MTTQTPLQTRYPDDLKADPQGLESLTKKERILYTFLQELPGSTMRDFEKKLDWSYEAARYYKDKLVREGLVYCDRDMNPHMHFALTGKEGEREIHHLRLTGFLNDQNRFKILECLLKYRQSNEPLGGWVTVNAIATQLDSSHGFVDKTINKFKEFGVVESRPTGFRQEVRVVDPQKVGKVLDV